MRLTSFSAHAFVLTMSMASTLASASTPTTNDSRSGTSPFVWILVVLALVVGALAVRRELRKRAGKLPSQQAPDKAASAPSGVTGVRVAPPSPAPETPASPPVTPPATTQPKPAPVQTAQPVQAKPTPAPAADRVVITPKPVEQPAQAAPARPAPQPEAPKAAPQPAPQPAVAPVAAAAPAPAKSDDLMDGFAFLGLGDFGGTLAPASGWLSALKTHPERVRGLSLEGGLALVHDDAGNNAAVPLGSDVGDVLDVPALRGLRLSVSDQGARVVTIPNGVYLVQGGTPLGSGAYLKPGVLYGLGIGTPPVAAASSFSFGSVLGAPNVEQFTSGGIDVKLLQNGRRLNPNLDPSRAHLIFKDDKLDVGQAYGIATLSGLLIDQQDEAAHLHAVPGGVAVWQGTAQLNLGHALEKGASYRLTGAGLDGYTLEWHG